MGIILNTPLAFLSYPHLAKPQVDPKKPGAAPKFGVALVFTADKDVSAIRDAIVKVAVEKFGTKAAKQIENGALDVAFRANARRDEFEQRAPGGFYLNARTIHQPTLVYPWPDAGDPKKPARVPQDEIAKVFRAGALVRGNIDVYAFDMPEKKGVTFGLNGLQFVEKGTPWTGAPDAQDVFDTLAETPNFDNLEAA
jgi:hypothetical protein